MGQKKVVIRRQLTTIALFFLLISLNSNSKPREVHLSTAEFPPFSFRDPDTEEVKGFNKDIIVDVFEDMGINPILHFLVFKRAYWDTKYGKFTGYFALTKTPERLKDFYFSDPISSVLNVLFKLKSKDISWDSYQDLADFKLGLTDQYYYDPYFLATIKSQEAISGDNPEERLLKMLINKRVDMVICEISVCNYIVSKNKELRNKIDFINKPIGAPEPLYFHLTFSKKWPEAKQLRDDFNKALKTYVNRPEQPRKAAMEKYGAICPEKIFPDCR